MSVAQEMNREEATEFASIFKELPARQLKFPDQSMGELVLAIGVGEFMPAAGEIDVPPGAAAYLTTESGADLSPLTSLAPSGLQAVRVYDATDGTCDAVRMLYGLTHLALYGPLSEAGLAALSSLVNLRWLDLETQISVDHEVLKSFRQLRFIRLVPARGSSWAPHLADLKELRTLHLFGSGVDDDALSSLTALPQVQRLSLESDLLTDQIWTAITAFENLVTLEIRGSQITGKGIGQLKAALPSLRSLTIRAVNFEPEHLRLLQGIGLEEMTIEAKDPDGVLRAVPDLAPPLTYLTLEGDEPDLTELTRARSLAPELIINGEWVSPEGVARLMRAYNLNP